MRQLAQRAEAESKAAAQKQAIVAAQAKRAHDKHEQVRQQSG